MNSILCLIIAIHFCYIEVNCRSLQLDDDSIAGFEAREDKDVNHDTQISGIFSWIRLKPILRREVQRITNVKDKEANKLNKESKQTTESIQPKDDENLPSEDVHVHINDDISMKVESKITNTTSSMQSELGDNRNEEEEEGIDESDVEEFNSTVTDSEILELNHSLVTIDFSDNVISDALNQTGDSIIFHTLNDNMSTITVDSLDYDETSLLSEGGHIATLQEFPTIGFELLIDSETKQNLLLAELLTTQSDLTDDDNFLADDNYFTDDSNFVTLGFNHSNENDMEDIATNEEQTDNLSVDFSTVEIENTEFSTDDDEIEEEVSDLDLTDPIQTISTTKDLSTESDDPRCPDPGWCVFWFLALDTCAKDSHCHGSLICCMVGCSKTCVDPDDEFWKR